MIKALKWAYDLGVRQERVRIASELQIIQRQIEVEFDNNYNHLRYHNAKNDNDEEHKNTIQFKISVASRVREIIDKLFEPTQEYVYGSSPLFPDDNHKGEL